MKLGWLWLSILNTTACPSPISITPAFSPGPWITHGAFVGSPRRWMREDLYEQCSFHIAEKIPSSVKLGTLPISFRMRSYSSGLRPCEATISGVILGSLDCMYRSSHIERICAERFSPNLKVTNSLRHERCCEDRDRYSITSSALTRIEFGNSTPRALAAFKLTTISKTVGCSIGRSAGLAPFSTLAVSAARRRKFDSILTP